MTESPSAVVRMVALAGWGFVLAKGLVIGRFLTGAWGAQLLPAVASSFGADVVVLLVVGLLGWLVERAAGTRRAVPWALGSVGVVLAVWALGNVALVVEVGRPLTLQMRGFGIGTREVGAMLWSPGARLAIAGVVLYVITAWPVAQWLARRPIGRRLVVGLAAYAVLAVGFVQARPAVASIYGLHRNAVGEVVLSTLVDSLWLDPLGESTGDLLPETFPVPPGESIEPVTWDRSVRPKHVVLWFAESTGTRYTSLFDPRLDTTPNIARLQGHSLQFTRYYAMSPFSEKALFAILYGMYPHPSINSMAHVNPRLSRTSIMEAFAARGWRTGFFTGALLGFGDKQKLLAERGFEVIVDSDSTPTRLDYWRYGWGIDDAAIIAQALEWIDARPDPEQSQFLAMVPIIPHVPYALPPHVPNPYGDTPFGKYQASVRYADALFGRFYDALVERGLADDTLIVWVGDHGEAFDQHPGSVAHGGFIYEENVHVPLMFVHPRMFPSATTSDRLGTHADLMPTILEMTGESDPPGGDGQSLVSDDFAYRPAFLGAYLRDHLGGVRDGRYKYVYNFDTTFEEVYDLSLDPHETDNIADEVDIEQVATWRLWVTEQQARQARRLEDYPSAGPSYLQRLKSGMRVYHQDGDDTALCRIPLVHIRAIGCEGQPPEVAVGVSRERLRGAERECVTMHPPTRGALIVDFGVPDPAPALIGAGLVRAAQQAGGAPVEVTWRLGDQEPIVMTLDDDPIDAYAMTRLPSALEPVPVRVEVRSSEWGNRKGCLTLSP